jgi:predicted aspartyl protease
MSTRKDYRFLFNMTVDGTPVPGLVDSGCTTVAIAADFVRKHKIRTTPNSSSLEFCGE